MSPCEISICWTDNIFIFQSRCYGHPPARSAGNRYHTRIIKTQKCDIPLQRSSDICSEATHPFMIGLHQRHPPGTYIEGLLYKYGNTSAVNILLWWYKKQIFPVHVLKWSHIKRIMVRNFKRAGVISGIKPRLLTPASQSILACMWAILPKTSQARAFVETGLNSGGVPYLGFFSSMS